MHTSLVPWVRWELLGLSHPDLVPLHPNLGKTKCQYLHESFSSGAEVELWWTQTKLTARKDLFFTSETRPGKLLFWSQGSQLGALWLIYPALLLLASSQKHIIKTLPEGTSTLTMGILICFRVTRIPEYGSLILDESASRPSMASITRL